MKIWIAVVVAALIGLIKEFMHRHSKTFSMLFSFYLVLAAIALLPVLILKAIGIDGPMTDILLAISIFSLIRTEIYHYIKSIQHIRKVKVPVKDHLCCTKRHGVSRLYPRHTL